MINISIFREANQIIAFKLSGHAESGPYGYDLVCAGVSAVSFGAVNGIHVLCNIELEIEQVEDGGYLYVALPTDLSTEVHTQAQLLLKAMIISLQTIEREYSQFIKIVSK